MLKLLVTIFCLFTLSSANLIEFFNTLLAGSDEIPVKVNSLDEFNRRINESVVLSFVGLVNQYENYTAEEHEVITEDKYVLKIHRIYANTSNTEFKQKPIVYIQHGLLGSSDFFVLLGPEHGFAFQLADAGYDVWLGNVRGNTYSRSHLEIDPKDPEFWNFSMDEMGLLDLSKSIDTVLNVTKSEKLTYIGYSMGTTLSYILLSSKLEYNSKINLVMSIAPVAYFLPPGNSFVSTVSNGIMLHATYIKSAYEILPQSAATGKYAYKSCRTSDLNPCRIFFDSFLNVTDIDDDAYSKIIRHTPAGTSFRTVEHYQQLNAQGKFQKYNFPCGVFEPCLNDKVYSNESPPEYNTSLISAPIAIIYSAHDAFVSKNDTVFLKNTLTNVVAFEEVTEMSYNHLDFILSKSSKTLVVEKILKIMSNYI